ncbi:MAG: chorismate synthase [Candidatus Cloacimonadales bacterium]|nr:chorismate synthase [Candidatus Cloacimonadales bacterium]
MKGNSYGRFLGFTAFGESHGPAIGLVIEDVKPGIEFPLKEYLRFRSLSACFSGEEDSEGYLVVSFRILIKRNSPQEASERY